MLPTSPRLCLPLLLAATLCAGRVGDAGAERPGDGSAEHPVERRLGTMGTWCDLAGEGARRDAALAASERAVRALEAAEARLSTWRQDTELWRLNQAPVGTPFPLSPALR